jgi:hypothetical protein
VTADPWDLPADLEPAPEPTRYIRWVGNRAVCECGWTSTHSRDHAASAESHAFITGHSLVVGSFPQERAS